MPKFDNHQLNGVARNKETFTQTNQPTNQQINILQELANIFSRWLILRLFPFEQSSSKDKPVLYSEIGRKVGPR